MRNGTDEPYFSPALSATDAVYAMFIGTNDLGVDALVRPIYYVLRELKNYLTNHSSQMHKFLATTSPLTLPVSTQRWTKSTLQELETSSL